MLQGDFKWDTKKRDHRLYFSVFTMFTYSMLLLSYYSKIFQLHLFWYVLVLSVRGILTNYNPVFRMRNSSYEQNCHYLIHCTKRNHSNSQIEDMYPAARKYFWVLLQWRYSMRTTFINGKILVSQWLITSHDEQRSCL